MSCVINKLSLHLRKTKIKVVLLLSLLYRGAILCLRSVFSATTDYRRMTLSALSLSTHRVGFNNNFYITE